MRVVKHWNSLPGKVVGDPIPANIPDKVGQGSEQPNLGEDVPTHCRRHWTRCPLKVSFKPNCSMILWKGILQIFEQSFWEATGSNSDAVKRLLKLCEYSTNYSASILCHSRQLQYGPQQAAWEQRVDNKQCKQWYFWKQIMMYQCLLIRGR